MSKDTKSLDKNQENNQLPNVDGSKTKKPKFQIFIHYLQIIIVFIIPILEEGGLWRQKCLSVRPCVCHGTLRERDLRKWKS